MTVAACVGGTMQGMARASKTARQNMESMVAGLADILAAAGGTLSEPQLAVLLHLYARERATAGELAEALAMPASSVSRCTRQLDDLGLVVSMPDADDLRRCVFRLANRGHNVAFEVSRTYGVNRTRSLMRRYVAINRAVLDVQAATGCGRLGASARRVVCALAVSDGPESVGNVQRLCGFGQSKTSMSMTALCKRGLVRPAGIPADSRKRLYELTDQGRLVSAPIVAALRVN